MTDRELADLVRYGREARNLEYKGPLAWDDAETKATLTKSILAMSNIRDGGSIVVGVEQRGESFRITGMSSDTQSTFTQDGVSAHVNEYADPYVAFTVRHIAVDDANLVAIIVEEFEELPVICRKDGLNNLQRGAIYTRTRRIPETAKVPTQAEMREIIEIAVEKGARKLQNRIVNAGLEVIDPDQDTKRRFDQQLGDL